MIEFTLGMLAGIGLTLYMTSKGFRDKVNKLLNRLWNSLMGKPKKKEVKK